MSRLRPWAVAFAVLHEASPALAQSADAGSPPPPEPPASAPNSWFDPPSSPEPEPEPQPGPAPAPAPSIPLVAECTPACGDGHVCVNGQCVSVCDPPCAEGEVCTNAEKCIRPQKPEGATTKDTWTLSSRRSTAGDYRHDGFYARLSLGGGYGWGSGNVRLFAVDEEPTRQQSLDLEGPAFGLILLIGGTMPGGVAIGFAGISTAVGEPTYETPSGDRQGGDVGLSLAGLFADWYPDPTDGFHLLAAAGLGGARLYEHDSVPPRDLGASGFAFALGGGYDLFVGRDFSMGVLPLFQYSASWFDVQYVGGSFQAMALTLHFALTYN